MIPGSLRNYFQSEKDGCRYFPLKEVFLSIVAKKWKIECLAEGYPGYLIFVLKK
jgi:hypothetical protein